jgi:hypothetical protein
MRFSPSRSTSATDSALPARELFAAWPVRASSSAVAEAGERVDAGQAPRHLGSGAQAGPLAAHVEEVGDQHRAHRHDHERLGAQQRRRVATGLAVGERRPQHRDQSRQVGKGPPRRVHAAGAHADDEQLRVARCAAAGQPVQRAHPGHAEVRHDEEVVEAGLAAGHEHRARHAGQHERRGQGPAAGAERLRGRLEREQHQGQQGGEAEQGGCHPAGDRQVRALVRVGPPLEHGAHEVASRALGAHSVTPFLVACGPCRTSSREP